MDDSKENLDEDGMPPVPPADAGFAVGPDSDESEAASTVDSAVSRLVDLLYFSQVRGLRFALVLEALCSHPSEKNLNPDLTLLKRDLMRWGVHAHFVSGGGPFAAGTPI